MHKFKIGRKRNLPDIVVDVAEITAPDGHLYTQDEIDVKAISNPDGSLATIDWQKQAANKFRKNVWESIRTTGLGGSDIGILLGHSHFRSILDLYYDKIGQLPVTQAPDIENSKAYLFDFGHKMEEFVAEQFEKRVFWDRYKEVFETKLSEAYGETIIISDIECVRDTNMYRCKGCPCLIADFDFLVRLTLVDGRILEGIFECKTTSPYLIAEKWTNAPPESYQDQINDYMLIGDYDFAIIACASDNNYNNFYAHLVLRDEENDKKILAVASEFWHNNVELRKAPKVEGNVIDAILNYEPTTDYSSVDFSKNGYVTKQLENYLKLKQDKSDYQHKADECGEKCDEFLSNIAQLLQGRKSARCKSLDGKMYVLEVEEKTRTSFTAKERTALIKDHPELANVIKSYTVTTSKRTMSLKKEKKAKAS